VTSVTLGYRLKLYPSRNKSDTLAALADLFKRVHTDVTNQLGLADRPRLPSSKGLGEFVGRAYRRAYIDYQRTRKAGHRPGHLKAELIDSAEIQQPRKAKGFDCWIMLRGTTSTPGRNGGFYVPAKRHKAINRALALPGARLNESALVTRRNGKWYAQVSVDVPLPEVQEPKGWLGCDVGARAAVTRSDGYKGPDLRPTLKQQRDRRAMQQQHGIERSYTMSPSRQIIAREARKAVTVCLQSGRGIALEDPDRLIRWRQHASRFFGKRVLLLAAIHGLCVQVINPAYTSQTCPRCGKVERNMRHKSAFRCWDCGYTHNADFVASQNVAARAYAVTGVSHGSLSLQSSPSSGRGADE
jgi:Putative transposase DNA-binding domain